MSRTVGIYAHVTDVDDSFGGIEIFAVRLADELVRLGYDVVVHCLAAPLGSAAVLGAEPAAEPRLTPAGTKVCVFQPRHGPGFAGCVAENAAVSRTHREEAIFAIGTRDAFVFEVAIGAGAELSTPVVSFVYNSLNERLFRAQLANRTNYLTGPASEEERLAFVAATNERLRSIVTRSDAVVVPTDYLRGELAALLGTELAATTIVNYHGVPAAEFPFRRRAEYRGRLLHLSRLMYPQALAKNYLWSCRFAHRLEPGEVVTMVGGGRGDTVVADYVERQGLAGSVVLAGSVPKAEVPRILADADVLLCPSMMEAGCQSLVEAIMSGCVPVALDFSGSAEVMRRLGLAEFLVSPELVQEGPFRLVAPDVEHAVEVLDRIRADWPGAQELVRRAADRAVTELSAEVTTSDLVGELRRRGLLAA